MNIPLILKIGLTRFSNSRSESNFVILYLPRMGSNFLAGKLGTHPNVVCHHELFNPEGVHQSLAVRYGESTSFELPPIEARDRDPIFFLKAVFSKRFGASTVGFKIGYSPFAEVFLGLLLNKRIKTIHLTRTNLLETFVSWKIADQTKSWINFANEKNEDLSNIQTVKVDVEEFKRYARKIKIYQRSNCTVMSR